VFFRGFRARLDALEAEVDSLVAELSTARAAIDRTAGTRLAAEIDDLRAAVDLNAATTKKTLQKVLGHIGAEKSAQAPASAPTRDALRSQYLPK
jgi:hypothetical protein